MRSLARFAFWSVAAGVAGGTTAMIGWAVRRNRRAPGGARRDAVRVAPAGPADGARPVIDHAVTVSADGRWEAWAPRVPVRTVTSVVLAVRAAGADGASGDSLTCRVEDPGGGTASRSVQARGGDWLYVRYPYDFVGAGLHRPGEYRVNWVLEDSGQVVAEDRFEVIP